MSIQRQFNRQYPKWIARAVASGADKRWPPHMHQAIQAATQLKDTQKPPKKGRVRR